ncbi:MAG: spore coat protein CotH [Clostridiales bacterium]|nr:spore coat protein CotH [Clostridiales bacterium]
MRRTRVLLLLGILTLGCMLTGCVAQNEPAAATDTLNDTAARTVAKVPVPEIDSLPLTDDPALYAQQDGTSLVYFYLTVKGGNAADATNHTFAQVNEYLNLQGMKNVEKIKSEILFQVGDEYGPLPEEIGFGETLANATFNVRGRSSTGAPQKSYRIDLMASAGLWRGQRAIAINKHPYDRSRLRNMLFFTLLQKVPDMTSLRTQFVGVFIKDETAGETAFTDLGLFTQVELPNGRYLRNHGLSRGGNLYKANMNEFFRYEDKIRLATDPLYDLAVFSEVLEPKTTEDHAKLIAMLDAVNDDTIPIERTVGQYFNLENITSFLAYNILMGNTDTNSQNYMLYSPVNSDIWYFICWDGDGCLPFSEAAIYEDDGSRPDWAYGVSNYWGMVLFNRMLRVTSYREALAAKVEELRAIITPEVIAAEIARYRTVVDTFTSRMPDAIHLNGTAAQLARLYRSMPGDVTTAYRYFVESLSKPMPFFLGDVTAADGSLTFPWGDAYSFDTSLIYYNLQVATDWTFAADAIVYEKQRMLQLHETIPALPAGDYYWRVVAQNESGKTQTAFDWFSGVGADHYGMRRFTVTAGGEVLNP